MALQIRRTGVDEYGGYVKALLCGNPGAGKTLTCSTWPNVLYASAEGGLMSVAERHVPFTEIKTSQELLALKNALDQAPEVRERLLGVPVDTVVIDTIDSVQKILIEERKESQHKEAMAIQDFGWLGDQMRGIVRGFRNLPVHVVMTCHIKKDSDPENGNLIYGPALQGQIGDEIAQYFDIVALLKGAVVTRVVGNESKRMQVKLMQTYPDASHPWIKDRSGKLAPEIELDFQNDFKTIYKAIFGDVSGVGKSSEIHDVDTKEVHALRQQRIEENLATKAADRVDEAPDEPPAAPEPAKKAPVAKKAAATKKAATKKAAAAPAPAAEKPTEEPAEKPADEPEKPTEAEATPTQPELSSVPEEAAEAPPGVDGETGEITEEPAAEEPAADEPTEGGESEEQATESEPEALVCEKCGDPVESDDQADLSRLRFRKVLDRKCFAEAKRAPAKAS